MRPKDLPFTIRSFSEREPSFLDGVLTIPPFYTDHNKSHFPEFTEKVNSFSEVHVEICSGNGEWIIEKAKKHPDILFIAVEKKFLRVRKIWSKMKNQMLSNLIICSGMGEDLFTHYVEDESVDKIYINFPDPWPKKRHAKHRIVKQEFLETTQTKLKKDCTINIATDSIDYSNEIIEVFSRQEAFENLHPKEGFTRLTEEYGGSYFERLWKDLGRTNRLHTFRKLAEAACALPKV
jgi:tRNA (guanine-N7-)-methyltransferase